MALTDAGPDLTASSPRPGARSRVAPYVVTAAIGGVIACVSLGALILIRSRDNALSFLMALAAGVGMVLVGVIGVRRRRVESDLAEAEAALRQIEASTGELLLRGASAEAPIRDPGTLLFGREFFDESLDRDLRRAAREKLELTILMIQVDGLQAVADGVVNAFLRAAGTALREQVRSFDIVGRYERDVLGVLMPGLSERQAGRRADELLAIVRKTRVPDLPPSFDGRLHAGLAVHGRHDAPTTAQSMIRRAHLAVYESRADQDGQRTAISRREGA